SGDPHIVQSQQNNKVVLKISRALVVSLRPESSSISLDSLPAWTIYQNAFASQGSRIRLRGPQDPEQLLAEIHLYTLDATSRKPITLNI
ncbi:MAG: hypothetical protein VXZ71_09695, partial [SAR324 cluster bacterium]|nr:hypothetical protein [SAR324 cluster bacterium]